MDIMKKPAANQFFDRCIKEALRRRAEEITPSDALLAKIKAEINDKERENDSMNKIYNFRRMKPVVIAALVLILSAATCFAAAQITGLVSSSSEAFDKFPTARQVERAVGYVPDYVEKFSNGFYFDSASVRDTAAVDSENNKVSESKGITFFYTKEGAQKARILTLSADQEGPGISGKPGLNEEVIKDGKFDLVYSQVTYKVVPEGYTPTAEENQQMEQGVLWISYGSEEVEISKVQSVSWVRDGIVYTLTDNGYELGKDEILGMAREVLEKAE
jgi:hypothetical protein